MKRFFKGSSDRTLANAEWRTDYARKRKQRRIQGYVSFFLAVFVAGFMFGSLKKQAITMETPVCGMEEHVHTEACFGYDHEETDPETVTELFLECHFVPHTHSETCFDEQGRAVCGYEETYIHVHDDTCYEKNTSGERRLVCPLNGLPAHEHTDACYRSELICELSESAGHTHTDGCYETVYYTDAEPECGIEETSAHVHTEACYETVLTCEEDHAHTDACFTEMLSCGMEEGQAHVHTLDCYPSMRRLICQIEETAGHIHDASCYAMVLDCPYEHVHAPDCFDEMGHAVCGYTQTLVHQHTEECFVPRTVVVRAGHVHSEACQKVPVCGYEEHVHTSACFSGSEEGSAFEKQYESAGSEESLQDENERKQETETESVNEEEMLLPEMEDPDEEMLIETQEELVPEDTDLSETEFPPEMLPGTSEAAEGSVEDNAASNGSVSGKAGGTELIPEHGTESGPEYGSDGRKSGDLPEESVEPADSDSSGERQGTVAFDEELVPETDETNTGTDWSLPDGLADILWAVPGEEGTYFAVIGLDEKIDIAQILNLPAAAGNDSADLETDSLSLQTEDGCIVCRFAFTKAVVKAHLKNGSEIRLLCAYDDGSDMEELWARMEIGAMPEQYNGTTESMDGADPDSRNGEVLEVLSELEEDQDAHGENGADLLEEELPSEADENSDEEELNHENSLFQDAQDSLASMTDLYSDEENAENSGAEAEEVSGTENAGSSAAEDRSDDTVHGKTDDVLLVATATDLQEDTQEGTVQTDADDADVDAGSIDETAVSGENTDAVATDTDLSPEPDNKSENGENGTEVTGTTSDGNTPPNAETADSLATSTDLAETAGEEETADGEAFTATATDLAEVNQEVLLSEEKNEADETELVAEERSIVLTYEGRDFSVAVYAGEDAGIPADGMLAVKELIGESLTALYEEQIFNTAGFEEDRVCFLRLLDLSIHSADGENIEPSGPVSVVINMQTAEEMDMHVVHFAGQKKEEAASQTGGGKRLLKSAPRVQMEEKLEILDVKVNEDDLEGISLTFETEGFSVYGVVGTTIEKIVLASDGHNYRITATYGAETGIPADADLAVEEISADSELYGEYVSKTENALGMEEGSAGYIRLFDISIIGRDDPGIKYQPAAGTAVDIRIELADSISEWLNVVHFADGEEEGKTIDSITENGEACSMVGFQADSFSVYSIVDAPEPAAIISTGWYTANSLDQIEELGENGFYVSYNGYYLTGDLVHNVTNNSDRDGLVATPGQHNSVPEDLAAKFYFSRVEGTDTFKIYVEDENGVKNYVKLTSVSGNSSRAGLTLVSEESDGTAFTIEKDGNSNNFYISAQLPGSNEYWWNRNNKDPGKGAFVGYNLKKDQNTAKVTLSYYYTAENDPYGLDGKTFGIAYNDDSVTAAGVSAAGKTVSGQERLEGVDMLIRSDVLTNSGNLLVAENSDIQAWTFESVIEDKYYIKTTVDGAVKYLSISGSNVTLVDTPADASVIKATPGTGSNSGKWHFTAGGYSLNYAGSAANGFNAANGSGASTWLNLVEKSTLTDEDFVEYSARKISASDDILSATQKDDNGEILKDDEGNVVYKSEKTKVVIYTRVWNETTKKYEFYAVDHDGSLVRVYDSGDRINWVGNKVNSALWEFTEYTNTDGTPNYYYELENTAYSGTYLVPQSEGIISDQTVGINLNGRREGFDYTTIVAWDDNAYAYSGLKIERNADGTLKVVTCPLDDADDFYFAVIAPPVETAGSTSEVTTVDNNEHGISIRMVDFNNTPLLNDRDPVQNPFFGAHPWDQHHPDTGLLSTDLTNGYPVTTAHTGEQGRSLSELFSNMTPANHLFIQSVYNESGYFEYDSTQNFAHLNEDGTFKVYNELGAIGTSTGPTRAHGQFMPYNDISPETGYATDSQGNIITNRYNVRGQELSDTDPRKGEPLYLIPQKDADYFFGMELSASFTQTPDGVDNWGHDIIFEFTGDDDFWLYVDEELVLDLGGIHSALPGSVNFRTGEVNVNGTWTTLKTIFYDNYVSRGHTAAEADEYVNNIFEQKFDDQGNVLRDSQGNEVYTFKDYTNHQMKMFYMERGAGASNLKMRFNLASVKPGTAELTKKLTGTSSSSNKLIQYPYQIWYAKAVYRTNEDGSYALDGNGQRIVDSYTQPVLLEQPSSNANLTGAEYAAYKGTNTLIPYKDSMSIDGQVYNNVFLLRAGETAVLNFPEDTYQYKIVECGVNTQVYEHVFVNGTDITGNGMLYNNTDTGTQAGQGETCLDFGIDYKTTEERPRVEYTNQMAPDVMRTLAFRKQVYGTDDELLTDTEAAAIEETFTFRLYLGNEYTDQNSIPPANMYSYLVKDPAGYYCRWNSGTKAFESLPYTSYEGAGGLEEYLATLGSAEKAAIVFTTSMNGTISNIHAGYTVEVRDLIVGTKYKIEERDGEIPRGYTRRAADGYVRTDLGSEYVYYTENGTYGRYELTDGSTAAAEPISDTIASKTDSPMIDVRNQEGWGLSAKKVWTDKDFVEHDDIFLAVYLKDENGGLVRPVGGTVRRLTNSETEAYWFFPDLRDEYDSTVIHSFDEYIVREVTLTGSYTVDADTGAVEGFETITPVSGNTVIGCTPIGGEHRYESYSVSYDIGSFNGRNSNIRMDTITNARPGIDIYKINWDGTEYLSGAVFTLKDSAGNNVAAASYTSGSEGLVTTAYLSPGVYTLDEIKTPTGYTALDEPITITVTTTEPENYDLTVPVGDITYFIALSGPEGFYSVAPATAENMARITVKNRTVQELKVVKVGVDGSTRTPLEGVQFALYDQVIDSEGNPRPAYVPKQGYHDLVTDEYGVITEIGMNLGTGTYYLRETAAPSGYKKLAGDLCFTIGADGNVTVQNEGYKSWLSKDTSVPGKVSYQISIENTPLGLTLRKTDEKGNLLRGAQFVLTRKNENNIFEIVSEYGLGENGLIDLTDISEKTFTGMSNAVYKLTETRAPGGYIITEGEICFSVSDGTAKLTDENGVETTYASASLADDNTTIVVKNFPGAVLPSTGGHGSRMIYLLGVLLISIGAGGLMVVRKRKTE